MRKLPPLNSLRVFEAAAQYRNFSKAALELGVTQGAVSKQIKLLEDYLGFNLFDRYHNGLSLTKEAEEFLLPITEAFSLVESATAVAQQKYNKSEILNLNILPTLALRWMVPLLDDFNKKYPNINISMETGDGEINLLKQKADIAIRAAKKPSWPQYYSQKLTGEKLLLVYSAKLAASNPIRNLSDLPNHKLLKHSTRPDIWGEYLSAIGAGRLDVKYGNSFEHFFMLIEAVRDGLGLALIPEILIKKELDNKDFIVALNNKFESKYDYYFICSKSAIKERKIESFNKWVLAKFND